MFHQSQTGRGRSTHKLLKSAKPNFFYIPHRFFFHKLLIANGRNCECSTNRWQLLRCNLRSHWSLHSLWQEAWNSVKPQCRHVLSVPGSSRGPNCLTCQLPSSRIWLESRCCCRPFWLALKTCSQWRIAFVPLLEERKEKMFDLPMRGIHMGQVAWKTKTIWERIIRSVISSFNTTSSNTRLH